MAEISAPNGAVSPVDTIWRAVSDLSREDRLRLIARIAADLAPQPAEAAGGQEERFRQLVARWKAERGPTSFVAEMATHAAYQQIIGMGPSAVPLLLRELERAPDHWFWALRAITGVNPVPPESRGRVGAMAEAWLRWGREQGYRW